MIIKFEFTDKFGHKYDGMRTEFDRNYDDEETAIFFVDNDYDANAYFEVNIRKNEEGKPMAEGYVCDYASYDDCEPDNIINDIRLDVTLHDFDDILAKANKSLLQFGKEIVLEYDGEMYWAVGTQSKAKGKIKWYAENDFDTEVATDINECWAHTLAMAKAKETREADSTEEPKNEVFVRLGIYINPTDGELDKIFKGDTETLKKVIKEKRFSIGGDTYIPSPAIESYNEENGTDYTIDDIGFEEYDWWGNATL